MEDILEAAVRVLRRDGATRFTTVRVAEEAGVSVGSLYQYFPNKQSLLFRLQADEWDDTGHLLEEILTDARLAPPDRVRKAVLTFFRSEQEEAALRTALDDAGAHFRDSGEAREQWQRATARLDLFMREALPAASSNTRVFAADFLMTSMSSVAERITAQRRPRKEIDLWARETAEMYCAFLERLGGEGGAPKSV